jgi:hypothetical protein
MRTPTHIHSCLEELKLVERKKLIEKRNQINTKRRINTNVSIVIIKLKQEEERTQEGNSEDRSKSD